MKTWLTETFSIKYPIIMAPMFLVSNIKMLKAAAKAGITGCVPALNWRTPEEFEAAIKELKKDCPGPFGINLIVNKSNIHFEQQLAICKKHNPDYIITSLGSPQKTIEVLKPLGIKIICDVVDANYAKKVEDLGADAIIAVNSGAGGHAGPIPASLLIPMLLKECNIPVISAGGVGTGAGLLSTLALGSDGVSIGSPFIACHESDVTNEYKDAVVKYGANDIVMTTKLSGTPCTVINTPYVKKVGTEQNLLESLLNQNKKLKKYAKMLTYYKGTRLLEKAAFNATYKTIWCAGPSIEFVESRRNVEDIVDQLISEYNIAYKKLQDRH